MTRNNTQMTQQKQAIQLFEERKVRTVWDDRTEEWYFSVVDVIEVLTDSADPKQYIKRMRSRDAELSANWGTICTLVPMVGADGKQRRAMAATTQGMFRIIQSIPSPKAEPFKQWMAQVAADVSIRCRTRSCRSSRRWPTISGWGIRTTGSTSG